jgi:hypothetical protein
MVKITWMGGVTVLVLAACNTPPPQPWLRFEPSGQHNWTGGPDGVWVARMHGADFSMDLNRKQTSIQVTVVNRSGQPVEVRMGAEASSPNGAIGGLLLRQLDAVGGPDTLPYNTMQKAVIENGWRGTFDIDSPLGRDPQPGTFLEFTVEARNQKGDVERRRMPMQATNAGRR